MIRDAIKVGAGVRRQFADDEPIEGRVPSRGVVGPALPGMVDGDKPRALGVASGGEVAVPGKELGVDVVQESPGVRERFPAPLEGDLPDS